MPTSSTVDDTFLAWLTQRETTTSSSTLTIAIQSPCLVCQPRIGKELAAYLNQFDEASDGTSWITINDHRFEQIQAHQTFRQMIGEAEADNASACLRFLSSQGSLIVEMADCHDDTLDCDNVFQVSLSCQEPEAKNHHLWLNAKRIEKETLIPMIANSFMDWALRR